MIMKIVATATERDALPEQKPNRNREHTVT